MLSKQLLREGDTVKLKAGAKSLFGKDLPPEVVVKQEKDVGLGRIAGRFLTSTNNYILYSDIVEILPRKGKEKAKRPKARVGDTIRVLRIRDREYLWAPAGLEVGQEYEVLNVLKGDLDYSKRHYQVKDGWWIAHKDVELVKRAKDTTPEPNLKPKFKVGQKAQVTGNSHPERWIKHALPVGNSYIIAEVRAKGAGDIPYTRYRLGSRSWGSWVLEKDLKEVPLTVEDFPVGTVVNFNSLAVGTSGFTTSRSGEVIAHGPQCSLEVPNYVRVLQQDHSRRRSRAFVGDVNIKNLEKVSD